MDVIPLFVLLGFPWVGDQGVGGGYQHGVRGRVHKEEAAVDDGGALHCQVGIGGVKVAVVVVQGFCESGYLRSIGGAAPDFHPAGRQGLGEFALFLVIAVFAAGLGEHYGAGHREEIVGFQVVQIPRRFMAKVHADGVEVVLVLRLPVAGAPFGVLAGAEGAVGEDHSDVAAVFEVEVGDAGEEQGGDVLVRGQFAAGPDAVGVAAEVD